MGFLNSLIIFLFSLLIPLFIITYANEATLLKGIDIENPVIEFTPSPQSSSGSKDVISCERVQVSGKSRFMLRSYANAHKIALAPSAKIPERLHSKIQVCVHKNASLGLCECEGDEWKTVQKGLWSSVVSPYGGRYIDVKFSGEISGAVILTVEEEFQRWRLLWLVVGLVLLLLSPVVSSWVPFYYSSSMAIGVFLVVIVLLFQGMKLLPTGRKNFLYLTLYTSVVGAGSFLLHQFSVLVNSILVNFGLTEEMHNPVSVFLLLFIILAGAALGFWIVRKFVISDDGSVDVGIAQFVKWAMRVIAFAFIFQSTLDTPLALGALASSFVLGLLMTSFNWDNLEDYMYFGSGSLWGSGGETMTRRNRAEFRSRPRKAVGSIERRWNSPRRSSPWSDSPVIGLVSPPNRWGTEPQRDYYSTFHKTPNKKKFTKKEWKNFTEESTKQAMKELASSPEFTDWVIENAKRIKLRPEDNNSDESILTRSDSSSRSVIEIGEKFSLFKW